jgi:hypothetical protein
MQHYKNVEQCSDKYNIPQERRPLYVSYNCLRLYLFLELKQTLSVKTFSDITTNKHKAKKQFWRFQELNSHCASEFAEMV